MNPDETNDNVPKAVGAPRAVKEADVPENSPRETPEKEPFDEAAYRERLKEDCLIACESWDVPNLHMLRSYIDGSATAGILTESVMAGLRRASEDRGPATVLAEMLKERRARDEERKVREG